MAEGRIYLSSVINAPITVDPTQLLSATLSSSGRGDLLVAEMVKYGHGAWRKTPRSAPPRDSPTNAEITQQTVVDMKLAHHVPLNSESLTTQGDLSRLLYGSLGDIFFVYVLVRISGGNDADFGKRSSHRDSVYTFDIVADLVDAHAGSLTENAVEAPACDGVGSFAEPQFVAVPQLESLKLGQKVQLVVLASADGAAFRARLSANNERFVVRF